MTYKDKKALKVAFDFPEPDKKQEFMEEFAKLSHNTVKKPILPVVMRMGAAAAMMGAIVLIFANMPKDTADFGNDNAIITVTETSSEADATAAPTAVTTTRPVSDNTAETSEVTSTSAGTTKTVASSETVTSQRTAASPQTTAVRTTAVHTTVRTTSSAEKNESPPVTSATTIVSEDIVTSEHNKDAGRDMRVLPDMIYPLRDKTINEDQMYPPDNSDQQQGPSVSKPVDTDNMLREMYKDSSAVILANVDEMLYTSINGTAVTAENLTVVSSFKGELSQNDRITVFFIGGYVPAEEYMKSHEHAYIDSPEEYSVYEKYMVRSRQEKEGQYIFFIRNDDENIKEGAYSPVRSGNTAVFRKIYDNYVSLDDPRLYFTEAQLNELG